MPTIQSPHRNRLEHETSPYLLQHAGNPVDWYPWGPEALTRAKSENRLILLSIGYSACHWCHVMERESFEDESTAALMNEHFVNVKVDREERPDLDDIYMAATLALNHGQGGWPMTVFLTPELEPVFAGTYFPPEDRGGRPGFKTLLSSIARAWQENRATLVEKAAQLVDHLREQKEAAMPPLAIGVDELRLALEQYGEDFDPTWGGFGPAPKFPPAAGLELLLRLHRRFDDGHALEMVKKTLDAMARGGIYDQIGGGFARYSVDEKWLVPHFEKMLYDNALLASAYLEGYQATGDDAYRRVATEVLDYVLREMTDPRGGFYSATDADSEGCEGKFFVWTPEEVDAVLEADEARAVKAFYDVTAEGNFEGKSILHRPKSVAEVAAELGLGEDELEALLAAARPKLYASRQERVPPGLDDKVLTSWNGMMIHALAKGHDVLGDERFLDAARRAAEFAWEVLRRGDGGLFRTYRAGKAHLPGFLEDYAWLACALVSLYETGGEKRWLDAACALAERLLADFLDEENGGFYNTARGHEDLLLRYRDGTDGATPSANAVAASALARLSVHLARDDFRTTAAAAINAYGRMITRYPRAFAHSLRVADLLLEGETLARHREGCATPEGTARFASRHDEGGFAELGTTGLRVSRLGFGCYRVADVFEPHREALERAVAGGVNLVDTSTNYTDGASERLVGAVLRDLPRDEVVVVSKIGYVQGRNYELAQRREAEGHPFPEMVKVSDGLWHCLHPEFLADQLGRSLDRLELSYLDVCLLHNPEYFLADAARRGDEMEAARDEFYRRLEAAFGHLEKEREAGRIGFYGVSSNTFGSPVVDADVTSLARMLEAARRAGGDDHGFRVLQLPLNLFESGPVFEHNTDDGTGGLTTVLELARRQGVGVLVNRPLNAFAGGGLLRLADVEPPEETIDWDEQRGRVARLEEEFRATVAPQPEDGDAPPLRWADELADVLPRLQGREQGEQVLGQVIQVVRRVEGLLERNLKGEAKKRWHAFRERYFPELERLLRAFVEVLDEKSRRRSRRVAEAIDPRLPAERRAATLSQKALWVAASTPGVTSVLCGMRNAVYVDDALAVLAWPPHTRPGEVYQAARSIPQSS